MKTMSPVIVYVHGMGGHGTGHTDHWFKALEPHLTGCVEKREVVCGSANADMTMADEDAVTVRTRLAMTRGFRTRLEEQLASRKGVDRGAENTASRSFNGILDADSPFFSFFDDLSRYMMWQPFRNAVLSRFDAVVTPLLQEGRAVHIIAHGWGAIVAYEGLRRHDDSQFRGRVANLIMLGSALSLEIVQWHLFDRIDDGQKPAIVDRFINIKVDGDIIGGPIDPPFATTAEFLLQGSPDGHTAQSSPDIERSPACAHRSYFDIDNVAINRNILAHYINLSNMSEAGCRTSAFATGAY